MNGYHLAIVAFVAGLATCGLAARATGPDFGGLINYLSDRFEEGDSEANFALYTRWASRQGGRVGRAADMLLALKDGNECNKRALSRFVNMKPGKLNVFALASNKFLRPHLMSVIEPCAKYIERAVGDKYAQVATDIYVAGLVKVAGEGELSLMRKSLLIYPMLDDQAIFMEELAKANNVSLSRTNLWHFFQDNIVQPCHKLIGGLRPLDREAEQVAHVYSSWMRLNLDGDDDSFRHIIWASTICEEFLNMDIRDEDSMFRKILAHSD